MSSKGRIPIQTRALDLEDMAEDAIGVIGEDSKPVNFRTARRQGYTTNDVLELYGFVGGERTNLFFAYDPDKIRLALEMLGAVSKPAKELLIATIDVIAREGHEQVRILIRSSADVVRLVKEHYEANPLPEKLETDDQAQQRIFAAQRYLVKKYIFSQDVQLPAPLKVEIGDAKYSNPVVIKGRDAIF